MLSTQDLLTAAATIVEFTGLIFTVAGILVTAFKSPTAAAPQSVSAPTTEVSEKVPTQPQQSRTQEQPQPTPIAPSVTPTVTHSSAPTQTNARKLSRCEVLRQQCAARGITWRNARGKGKHLTTKEMQQYLGTAAIA